MKTRAVKNSEIKRIIEDYLDLNKNEACDLKLAYDQAKKASTDSEITSRKNFVGHFTASIFLIDKSNEKVLLLDHKGLKMMLQPGGHIEENELPLDAALRELKEEAGLNREQVDYRPVYSGNAQVPVHISSHRIPKNNKKNEDEHYHHDLEYVFFVDHGKDIITDQAESEGYQWVSWENFSKDEHFAKQAPKIKELITSRSDTVLYYKILQNFMGENLKMLSEMRCIAIEHVLPSTFNFLLQLNALFGKMIVFAKPNSINHEIYQKLVDKGITIKIAEREPEKDPINYFFGDDLKTKTILFDIGGYFAEMISHNSSLPIVGIIEDTENGYKRYSNVVDHCSYRLSSVARSKLKENEDFLVGKAITRATDTVLRSQNILIEYCQTAVIGYGKIGKSIARCLLEHNVKPLVVEKDPIRALSAANEYCYVSNMESALKRSKIIFSASGSKAISIKEFRIIRNGAFLIPVTSSDDEFDSEFLLSEYKKQTISKYIEKYSNDNNYFYLVNNGYAPNFLFDATLGSFIYPTLALCLTSILLMCNKNPLHTFKKEIINELNYETEQKVAELWLDEFIGERFSS